MFLASLSAVHEPAQVTRGGFHDRPIIHIKLGALTLTCSVDDARNWPPTCCARPVKRPDHCCASAGRRHPCAATPIWCRPSTPRWRRPGDRVRDRRCSSGIVIGLIAGRHGRRSLRGCGSGHEHGRRLPRVQVCGPVRRARVGVPSATPCMRSRWRRKAGGTGQHVAAQFQHAATRRRADRRRSGAA